MAPHSPEAILAILSETQREILASGPSSFAEADALPEGLFEEESGWDRETGDEWFVWEATDLGREVRALAERRGEGKIEAISRDIVMHCLHILF